MLTRRSLLLPLLMRISLLLLGCWKALLLSRFWKALLLLGYWKSRLLLGFAVEGSRLVKWVDGIVWFC